MSIRSSIGSTVRTMLEALFRLCPVQHNKILFIADLGKGYSCNPKYLSRWLGMEHPKEFRRLWVYSRESSDKIHLPSDVTPIPFFSYRYLYHIATAGIIVSNHRLPHWFRFRKRKRQRYLQTWHSSIRLKKIEGDAFTTGSYVEAAKADSQKTDCIISGCKFSTDIIKRAFWYDGRILECGTPRTDYLLNITDAERKSIFEDLDISEKFRYALYAPTFRKGGSLDAYNMDYARVSHALEQRFGGQFKILMRLHPNLRGNKAFANLPDCCIDVTSFPDIQELIPISDVMITDFSSCMFDMAMLHKPCFLYASDYDDYIVSERGTYFQLSELPFSIATNNDNLCQQITSFDNSAYEAALDGFMNRIGSFENGKACELIYEQFLSTQLE